ncbi:MAG: ABC transporter ATPase [Bacteroidota bacterium]
MLVDFNSLPDNSKVWIYQSNKEFSKKQQDKISVLLDNFVDFWTHHGDDIKGSYDIKYGHFIILAIDESYNAISGCSIDASINIISEIENKYGVELLNRMNTAFRDGENINIVSLPDFQKYAKMQKILPETIVFNNMITTKEELKNEWEVKANQSWHKRYF